jgi:hypothetical protein
MESQKDANIELKASLFSGINIEKGKNMWRYSGSRIACPAKSRDACLFLLPSPDPGVLPKAGMPAFCYSYLL